jgi:hypothetical protein
MKKIISGVLIAASFLMVLSVKAQTADDIVNKYVDAIGGKDKIKAVSSLYMEGTVQIMGNENPTKITILNGKGYKTEMEFNGQKIVQCFTDKGGWAINPMAGGGAEAMPDEAYKAGKEQIEIGGQLFDYTAKGSTVSLLGKDGNDYKLKLVTKDKDESTYFIDATTYYLTRIVKKGNMMGQEVEVTLKFSDFKKTDQGLIIPFAINTELGQFAMASTITKAEVNKPVDASIFVMP